MCIVHAAGGGGGGGLPQYPYVLADLVFPADGCFRPLWNALSVHNKGKQTQKS